VLVVGLRGAEQTRDPDVLPDLALSVGLEGSGKLWGEHRDADLALLI
jgi:hypothetical protein